MDKIITLDWVRYKKIEIVEADYYISISGEVINNMFENTEGTDTRKEYWNSFKTSELAQKELNTRRAIVRVKKYIAENFGVWELTDEEWEDGDIDKHYICFDYSDKSLVINCFWRHKSYSPIWYLENKAICSDVIANCKEDLEIIFK